MILGTSYIESGFVDYEDLAKEVVFPDQFGVLKITSSRRGEYSFFEQQIAEIEYRLEALKPYISV